MIKDTKETIKPSKFIAEDDRFIRFIHNENSPSWYIVTDVCRYLDIAIRGSDGQPNVTHATYGIPLESKRIVRIETPESPNNPWIDLMAMNYEGMTLMTQLYTRKPFDHFINQMEIRE